MSRTVIVGAVVAGVTSIAAVYLYVALGFCDFCDYSPAHRAEGVPRQAVWAGGPDGGSYIWCQTDQQRDVNVCTVWNDFTGGIAEQGEFKLRGERRAATTQELSYLWADRGGWIGLKGGKILEHVGVRRQFAR